MPRIHMLTHATDDSFCLEIIHFVETDARRFDCAGARLARGHVLGSDAGSR